MNKSIYNTLKLLGISIMVGFTASCDRFLELTTPKTELVTPLVFSSDGTANAAMLSVFAQMSNEAGVPTHAIPLKTGLLSDEFENYSTNNIINEYFTNELSLNNDDLSSTFWQPYYNVIFQCNAILEGVEESALISSPLKKQLEGEAKFLRAYFHFCLTNLFGAIPIITKTDYRINAYAERTSRELVYEFVIKDLLEARDLLNDDYVGADGITSTSSRLRPNKFTVRTLLARTYLYQKNYAQAEIEATAVIDNPSYRLEDLDRTFLNSSLEAIWQIQRPAGFPTREADMFALTSSPSAGLTKMTSLRESLIELFSENDLRRLKWVGEIEVNGDVYYFPRKYKNNDSEDNLENSTIFRLAELYLIRSEARLRLGIISEGLNDLNQIRERANLLPLYFENVTNPLFLVNLERQRELFVEGHRWFDLIRMEMVDEVMEDVTASKGGVWVSTASVLPIPQIELDRNPNLTQNEGY